MAFYLNLNVSYPMHSASPFSSRGRRTRFRKIFTCVGKKLLSDNGFLDKTRLQTNCCQLKYRDNKKNPGNFAQTGLQRLAIEYIKPYH